MPATSAHTDLRTLIAALRRVRTRTGYERAMRLARLDPGELLERATWNARKYTRTCLLRTDAFELMLICFEPGQRTSIHDYGEEEGWVLQVMGGLLEERYGPCAAGGLERTGELRLAVGDVSHLDRGASIHRFTNPMAERAMTLNLYARPLRSWNVYEQRNGNIRTGGTPIPEYP